MFTADKHCQTLCTVECYWRPV